MPRDCAYSAGMPSSVVIALPLTAATGVTHERISLPSSSTEHAPHCARPQPKRGPCRCSSLCRTYRSGVSRLAVTLCTRPFTLIFSLLAIRPPNERGLRFASPRNSRHKAACKRRAASRRLHVPEESLKRSPAFLRSRDLETRRGRNQDAEIFRGDNHQSCHAKASPPLRPGRRRRGRCSGCGGGWRSRSRSSPG